MAMSVKPQVNFSGGECSPSLYGRSDTVPYYAMGKTLENVLVTHYGSVFKTPGTVHVQRTKTMSENSRLIPFIFSTGDSYIMEFGDAYIRFYRSGGSIVEAEVDISGITEADPGVVTTSTAHGYTDGDAVDISGITGMTELNGKRFLVANKTSNTFELQDENGDDVDTSAYTTYVSDGTCEKVYQIVSPYAEEDLSDLKFTQQGDIMYFAHPDYEPYKLSRTASATFSIAAITYDTIVIPPFLSINTTATTITPAATTGSTTLTASTAIFSASLVGSYIQLTQSTTTGYVKVTAYTDTTHVTVTVVKTLDGTSATDDWYWGAWSGVQGYPTDVKFYEQRLYYAATDLKPLTIWGSVFGEFENFEQGSDDADSVQYTLGSAQVDKINWMYPASVLNCGTAGGPFTLSSGSNSLPITPTNISVKQQNENGCSTVSPVRIDSFIYYGERSGRKLGQFAYNLDIDGYITDNITYLSDHILGTGIREMALQKYPYNILWCVRNDGTVATMTRETKNDVKGWTRQVFGGTDTVVKSVAVIPNGSEDQVWLIVERTINEVTTKYVEYMSTIEFDAIDDAWFVQSGLEYDSTATTTISGLDHLEGESVQILADGSVHPNKTVTNGAVTLDRSASHVIAGLGYTATIQTLDLDIANIQQTAQAKVKSIGKASIRFKESVGCQFGDGTTTDRIPFRTSAMEMDEPVDMFSGDKEVTFPSGYNKNKYIYLYQEQPLPMHVLGIYPKMLISY